VRIVSTSEGLATEIAAALTRVAFEVHQVNRVEIRCDPSNSPSAAVAKKLGFTREATLRQRLRGSGGQLRDAMIWTLFKDEYPESPAASYRIKAYDAIGARFM